MLPPRALRALSAFVFFGTLLIAGSALAQGGGISRLVYNLANSDDFRVRTQAALALGASKDQGALSPLCAALSDSNTTVRAAAAAALGRLALPSGQQCMDKRLASETSDVVRATIAKALEMLAGGAEPIFGASTRFYISIGKTTDKTGRTAGQVDAIVRAAMTSKVRETQGFLAAPPGESPADAKRRLAKHASVKGYFLSPGDNAPDYAGGNLKVKIELAMLSYPDKNLIGSFSVNLTEPGVDPGSTENETDLIRMAAERAVDKFAAIAANQ
jgi:hypothetical protein